MYKGAFTAVYSTFFFKCDLGLFYWRSNPLMFSRKNEWIWASIKQTKIALKEKSTVNGCKRALIVQKSFSKTRKVFQLFVIFVLKCLQELPFKFFPSRDTQRDRIILQPIQNVISHRYTHTQSDLVLETATIEQREAMFVRAGRNLIRIPLFKYVILRHCFTKQPRSWFVKLARPLTRGIFRIT